MGGYDHRERATLGSSNGMLEFLHEVSDTKRCSSNIHGVCGDGGESRVYYDFNIVEPEAIDEARVMEQTCNRDQP